MKKLVFRKFRRILLKPILNECFQFIYLQNIFFKLFDSILFVFNFLKKKFTLSKEFITKFQFGNKNYFYLFLQKMNEFLQFCLQKYYNLFSFKKSDLYKLLKKYITLFAEEFLIKKLIFGTI